MKEDSVIQRNFRIERKIEECAAAAADQKNDECLFRCAAQEAQCVLCGAEGIPVGEWMASGVVADSPVTAGGFLRGAADATHVQFAGQVVEQRLRHGDGGFAQSDDQEFAIVAQLELGGRPIRSHLGWTLEEQGCAVETNAITKGALDAAHVERMDEDGAGVLVERVEGRTAVLFGHISSLSMSAGKEVLDEPEPQRILHLLELAGEEVVGLRHDDK